jgi:hypothetical protein
LRLKTILRKEILDPRENMINIERLAVEDFLGLEKEEIGALSSQLNKARLASQKRLAIAITPSGELWGDFFVYGKGRNCWLLREDKQKEDSGMFFSGLDLAQPAKTRRAYVCTTGKDYQSPLKMISGVIFLFF